MVLEWEGVRRAIHATQEQLADPKPALKLFSKKLTADIKANIEAGGTGWPPYAASTLKRMQSAGTSQISARGTVRSDRIKRTLKALKRLERHVRDNGWDVETRAKYAKIEKRIKNFKKAEARAAKRGVRTLGKRQSERHPMLQRIPGTIRNKLEETSLLTYSRADEVGKVQNDGGGRTPKREFLPPPNLEENLAYLAELLERPIVEIWDRAS